MKLRFVPLLALAAFSLRAPAAVLPGSLPGEVSVTNSGAAVYSIPISVPAGTGGVQPSLAFQFNSQGGNGLLGVGWSLAGLSAIQRVPSNPYLDLPFGARDAAVDGFVANPSTFSSRGLLFTNADRFALDGQPLVPVSGANGAHNTEYRTELDSFVRVRSYGSQSGGPSYFVVETKDGLKMFYGQTVDSRISPSGKSHVMIWALNYVEDTLGNRMTYHYTKGTNEYRLARIDYTLKNGSWNHNQIEFVYETRPSDDRTPGYLQGSEMVLTQRLREVRVKEGGVVLRTYALTYNQGVSTRRSRLASIQLKVGGDELPATTLLWTERSFHGLTKRSLVNLGGGAYEHAGDFNGDGVTDSIAFSGGGAGSWGGIYTATRATATTLLGVVPGDPATGTPTTLFNNAQIGLPEGMIPSAEGAVLLSTGNFRWWAESESRLGDFNGDGLTDVVTFTSVIYEEECGAAWEPCDYDWMIEVWITVALSDGTTLVRQPSFLAYTDYFMTHGSSSNGHSNARVLDLNGDGRSDIILDAETAFLSTGNGFEATEGFHSYGNAYVVDFDGDGRQELLVSFQNGNNRRVWIKGTQYTIYAPSPSTIVPADLNGDGLTDLVATWKSGSTLYVRSYLSTGIGFVYGGQQTFSFSGEFWEHQALPADVNGDGRTDLILLFKSGSSIWKRTYLSNGRQLIYKTQSYVCDWVAPSYGSYEWPIKFHLADVDGDGRTDLVRQHNTVRELWHSGGQTPDLLRQVTNGLGAVTEIHYTTLADDDVYADPQSVYDALYDDPPVAPGPAYPYIRLRPPVRVVHSLGKDDGLGTPAGDYLTHYAYSDAAAHAFGYGFLGFRAFSSADERSGRQLVQILRQDYPFTGMTVVSETLAPDPLDPPALATVSRAEDTPGLLYLHGGKTVFPHIATSRSYAFELSVDAVEPVFDLPFKTTTTSNAFDHWGNLTEVVVRNYAGSDTGTLEGEVTTTSVFEPGPGENGYKYGTKWVLGRLEETSVRHRGFNGQPDIVRESAFTYFTSHGLLATETIQPDGAQEHTLTTAYTYDVRGNITRKEVTGWNGTTVETRAVEYDYTGGDGTGRQLSSETVDPGGKNFITAYTYYNTGIHLGRLHTVTDLNGLTATTAYDAFGRVTRVTDHLGNYVETSLYGSGNFLASDPNPSLAGLPYATSSVKRSFGADGAALGPPSTAYHDRLGRTLRSTSVVYQDGLARVSYADALYDALGRRESVTEAYFAGDLLYWNSTTYDNLGRPFITSAEYEDRAGFKQTVKTRMVYRGLEASVISNFEPSQEEEEDEEGSDEQASTVRKNSLGQDVRITDNLGDEVLHSYDAVGNLIKTVTADGLQRHIGYDTLARRKISMHDPDMGHWTYGHNAFGELLTQTDANGTTTSMTYDRLGRMLTKDYAYTGHADGYVMSSGGTGQTTTLRWHYARPDAAPARAN
jgi:YD repeat-containing protein